MSVYKWLLGSLFLSIYLLNKFKWTVICLEDSKISILFIYNDSYISVTSGKYSHNWRYFCLHYHFFIFQNFQFYPLLASCSVFISCHIMNYWRYIKNSVKDQEECPASILTADLACLFKLESYYCFDFVIYPIKNFTVVTFDRPFL